MNNETVRIESLIILWTINELSSKSRLTIFYEMMILNLIEDSLFFEGSQNLILKKEKITMQNRQRSHYNGANFNLKIL